MRLLLILGVLALVALPGCTGNHKYSDKFIPINGQSSRLDLTELPIEFDVAQYRAKASAYLYHEIVVGSGTDALSAKLEFVAVASGRVLTSTASTRAFDSFYEMESGGFGNNPERSVHYEISSSFGSGYYQTTVSKQKACTFAVVWGLRNLDDDNGRPGALMLGYICRDASKPFSTDEASKIIKAVNVKQIVYDGKGIITPSPAG